MTLSPLSRYRSVPVLALLDRSGRARPTVGIRPQPDPAAIAAGGLVHTVIAGETLEALAARYLGSSEAWWRIADANPAEFPFAPEPGHALVIPVATSPGRVERTRTF